MTAHERTGWRDQLISERHRQWGFNCPAVDLDFLMVEYNLGQPVAIVEYKCAGALQPNLLHPTYRAITSLADKPPAIPFLLVFYTPGIWSCTVLPVNNEAKQLMLNRNPVMSEKEYVTLLYELRHLAIAHFVLSTLSDTKPATDADATALACV